MKETKRIYAVIDTNVLVSALFSSNGSSNPALVIKAVITGDITPIFNWEIIQEYEEVLSREKFNFDARLISTLISVFKEFGVYAERTEIKDEMFPDPDDIVFYEVTMSVEDAYLVTGNIKHFPHKPFIVTPSEMVDILHKRNCSNPKN